MKDKIANEIALRQMAINELKSLKKTVNESIDDSVKFNIITRHIFNFMDIGITKQKSTLDISVYTMNLILDEAIKKEKDCMDKLINAEVERKLKNEGNLQIK